MSPGVAAGYGVGVVGLGVGEQHARAFAAHPAVRTVKVCDLDHGRAEDVAARTDVEVARDFESIVADPDLDIVSIASFDDAHFEQVCRSLSAGKHVFVEKPLCRSFAELSKVHALWRAAQGRLHLGCNLVLRAAPAYAWLREAVRAGEFGSLYAFDGDYLYGRLHKIVSGWRRDVPDYSVMQGGGIHLIDLMLWITGERPVQVTAAGNRLCSAGSGFEGDDFQAATLRFPSGLVARITANFGCVQPHQHVVRLFGTRRTFVRDDCGVRVFDSRDPGDGARAVTLPALPASKGDLIPGFLAAIDGAGGDPVDTQAIFDGLSVAFACDRAAHSGQCETIEYL